MVCNIRTIQSTVQSPLQRPPPAATTEVKRDTPTNKPPRVRNESRLEANGFEISSVRVKHKGSVVTSQDTPDAVQWAVTFSTRSTRGGDNHKRWRITRQRTASKLTLPPRRTCELAFDLTRQTQCGLSRWDWGYSFRLWHLLHRSSPIQKS